MNNTIHDKLIHDIYVLHHKYIRYAVLHGYRKDLAEEITSQTFEQAIKSIRNGKVVDNNLKSWLAIIAKNKLIDYQRKEALTKPMNVDLNGAYFQIEDVLDDDFNTIKEEQYSKIYEASKQLSESIKLSFTQFYRDGRSAKEISSIRDISINTVLGHLRYARIQIANQIKYKQQKQ